MERRIPKEAPKHLGAEGMAAWAVVMSWAPLLLPEIDALAVERLCSLIDERSECRAEMTHGALLEEPIVSPNGKVVGTRRVANPAVAMLRQLDKALDALSDRLGLVPAARARLGLTLTTAEKQALEVSAVLAAKFEREPQ